MSQPSIALIFNPAARGDKARRFRESLGQLRNECTLLETTGPGSATALAAQAVHDGCKTIVASGGDGTVNEVVNGLAQARSGLGQAQLGILPLGTMNVFARELGIPLSPRRAWETVRLGQARAVDLPLAKVQTDAGQTERCFVQMALPFDQSKSMMDQPTVRSGSMYPLLLPSQRSVIKSRLLQTLA